MVLVLNRFDDIPDFVQQVGVLAECTLTRGRAGDSRRSAGGAAGAQRTPAGMALPEPDQPDQLPQLAADAPRVILRNGVVSYNDHAVIDGLNWQVNPGEHWQIIGPNGAGKSTCSARSPAIIRRATAMI